MSDFGIVTPPTMSLVCGCFIPSLDIVCGDCGIAVVAAATAEAVAATVAAVIAVVVAAAVTVVAVTDAVAAVGDW